jgi:hypothetical protein
MELANPGYHTLVRADIVSPRRRGRRPPHPPAPAGLTPMGKMLTRKRTGNWGSGPAAPS